MSPHVPPVRALVPHSGPMVLLDEVESCDEESLVARVTIRDGAMFVADGRAGAWVAIEYLAQAISAWAGFHAVRAGGHPKVGFLLGTRHFECKVPSFAVGTTLTVAIRREFQTDEGMAAFACSVRSAGEAMIEAVLTVFQPNDPAEFLKETPA